MQFLKRNLVLLSFAGLGMLIGNSFGNNNHELKSEVPLSSSSGIITDPFGFWKSTGGMLRRGIRMFRDNLHEGVKIAKMLKEDVDDGLSHFSAKDTRKGPTTFSTVSKFNSSEDLDESNSNSNGKSEELTFMNSKSNPINQLQREGMLGGILRLAGFDSNSIGIIVLNVLIFIAEMVTSSLLGKESNSINDRRMLKTNIFEWFLTGHNPKVEHILEEAQNKSLPENIINLLQTKTGNRTSCVQLLLCKLKPFIWGVQKTVSEQMTNGSNITNIINLDGKYFASVWDELNQALPSKNNFIDYGNNCEIKYPVCQLLKFQDKRSSG